MNKQDYLEQVQIAVSQLHNCGATWRETVPVHEVLRGETVWQGDVEVFGLTGHPKAKRCYAWSHLDGKHDERTRFVAVLEIPPVESAETAVRVQIVKDAKEAGKIRQLHYRQYKDVINAENKTWKSEARKLMENGVEFLVVHLSREDFNDSKFLRQEFDYVGLYEDKLDEKATEIYSSSVGFVKRKKKGNSQTD